MNSETWQRARGIFEAAVELPVSERKAFLDQEANNDDALFDVVQRMLDDHESSPDWLQPPTPADEPRRSGPALQEGQMLANYRILHAVAHGGMGAVYEAVQEPLKRRVALKTLLFHSVASESAHQRFHYEAELLAHFSHPAIAQIYASGVEIEGGIRQPWIAMEFVEEARDILSFADDEGLDREARIRLFLQVCDAVEYAHGRGVLHRDLKPSNLLVGTDGELKLIDFGIAREADDRQLLNSALTRTGELLGTMCYMGPEQLKGDQGSMRSDVYALGVVLFQLLTGRLPITVSGLPITEAIARLSDDQPLAALDGLPRELDWVLRRCLERDPSRRYASADELARDLIRYQDGSPVLAAPPSSLYLASKFIQRHRLAVGTLFVISLAVVLGGAAAGWGLLTSRQAHEQTRSEQARTLQALADLELQQDRTARALDRVETEAGKLRATNSFIFDFVDSAGLYSKGRDLRVADLLSGFAEGIEDSFVDQPEVATSLYATIARAQRSLGLFGEAALVAQLGLEQVSGEGPAVERSTYELQLELALTLTRVGSLVEAEGLFDSADAGLRSLEMLSPSIEFNLLKGRAALAEAKGHLPESITWKRRALLFIEEASGENEVGTLEARLDLAMTLSLQAEPIEARELAESAVARMSAKFGADHARTLIYRHNLATVLGRGQYYEDGVAIYEDLLPKLEQAIGSSHDQLADAYNNYAVDLFQLDRIDDAASAFIRAISIMEDAYGPGSRRARACRGNLAAIRARQGKFDEAVDCYVTMVEGLEEEFGYHYDMLTLLSNISWIELERGATEAAIAAAEEALALGEDNLREDDPVLLPILTNLAQALASDGQVAGALDAFERLISIESDVMHGEGKALGNFALDRARLLVRSQQPEEAAASLESIADLIADKIGAEAPVCNSLREQAARIRSGL